MRWLRGVALLFALVMSVVSVALGQGKGFSVGGVTAQPGTRVSGYLEVSPIAGVDGGVKIPVTVIYGTKPGPVLGLVAGTHGYEYAPIVAMQRMPSKIEPAQLSGTVIVVHVANIPSFFGRTVYYSPIDGKNLNRVYPGKPEGTVSERIAHAITKEVIEKSDYVIDLHCGDGNEDLRPYSYWMRSGAPDVTEKSKELALAFGLRHIVIDDSRSNDPAASIYTSNTAITRGKPSITTETGGLGRVDGEGPALVETGVFRVMRYLKMLPGEPRMVENPIWIDGNEVLRSPVTGLFYAHVKSGEPVAKGTLLGEVTDLFGKTVEEIRAPFAGVVLYVVATPPVSKGEPLGMVGHIQTD